MEEDIQFKMKEFMAVLDQLKRYRALLALMPDFLIILGLTITGFLAVSVISHIGLVFITYTNPSWIPLDNTVQIIFVLIGIFFSIFYVNRKLNSVKGGQWQKTLTEGTPGAIKLLEELDWDNVYRDIRYAKLGFWLYGLLKTAAYWLLVFVVSSFAAGYLENLLHLGINNLLLLGLFSLALVLSLNTKDIKRRFDQIGRLDALLWELRWFDYEFRKDFQA